VTSDGFYSDCQKYVAFAHPGKASRVRSAQFYREI
jgi:hypothetical protein